ncbi:Ribonuclease P protein component 2 [Candidatus Methanobinarius endosymbioticus]|uniref:Ribonuclease P protein component 2 n=1 Tax=Candidatus Methanobinarius endosymbioticus TaxID=2006182 RepID=A0A366MAR4_9EURY|nr:Ribonuclease P protein component 2 [Candidatus Methanobinarius endosymbioticus]
MKLKILPPTLRINKRYLVLDVKSEVKLSKDELVSAIWYGCLRLYGESETSAFNLWLIKFYDIADNNSNNHDINNKIINNDKKSINGKNSQYYHFKAVLRCQRGYEDKIRGSLSMLSNHNNKKIAISTIGISGTIASSIENFIN